MFDIRRLLSPGVMEVADHPITPPNPFAGSPLEKLKSNDFLSIPVLAAALSYIPKPMVAPPRVKRELSEILWSNNYYQANHLSNVIHQLETVQNLSPDFQIPWLSMVIRHPHHAETLKEMLPHELQSGLAENIERVATTLREHPDLGLSRNLDQVIGNIRGRIPQFLAPLPPLRKPLAAADSGKFSHLPEPFPAMEEYLSSAPAEIRASLHRLDAVLQSREAEQPDFRIQVGGLRHDLLEAARVEVDRQGRGKA